MNPFELTAGPFLALYATLYGLASIWAWNLRRGPAGPAASAVGLTPVDFAWLAGGEARAADAAVISLVATGAATLAGEDRTVVPAAEPPGWLAPFWRCLRGATPARSVAASFAPALARVRVGLEQRGLVLSAATAARLAHASAIPFLLLILFGATRTVLGIERGRPVGILLLFLGVTILHGLILAVGRPWRTRAGRAALREAQTRNARLMRAPEDGELAFAFALAGAAVLVGTPLAAYADWRGLRTTSGGDSSGSDGGSSDSGGGDSGGSDSGGSGCGGCSS